MTFAPPPELSAALALGFQQKLAEREIVFQQVQQGDTGLMLSRHTPEPLQVNLTRAAPNPVGQLGIGSERPQGELAEFAATAELVIDAYAETWSVPAQLLARNCVVRYLYHVEGEHAFKYLWEKRLGQKEAAIGKLSRPILGGGLRFFMPARAEVHDDSTIDVRIESFFQDARQLFVETQALWMMPLAGEALDATNLLHTIAEYATGPVIDFVLSEDGHE
jgi:hypothetical protein